jgi:hypothetical protein
MPVAIPAIIAAASAAATGVTVFGLGVTASAFVIGGVSLASGLLQQSLAKKPKNNGYAVEEANRSHQIKQAIMARRVVYGRIRASGATPFLDSTDSTETFHSIMVLATHEIAGVDVIFINDDPVPVSFLDEDGKVTKGKYKDLVEFQIHLGADDQEADERLTSASPKWTVNHRLQGCAYIYGRFKNEPDIFSGLPKMVAEFRGKKLYDPRTETSYFSQNPALAVYDWNISKRFKMGIGEDSKFINTDSIIHAANICDEFVDVKEVIHKTIDVDPVLDELHLSGDVIKFYTGDRVELSLTGDPLPEGLQLNTNYYVIVTNQRKHDSEPEEFDNDIDIYPTVKLAETYDDALAGNAIDITSDGGVTVRKNGEPRYSVNGEVFGDEQKGQVLSDLLLAMAGETQKIGEQRYYQAGAYVAPDYSFDLDDLVGGVTIQTRISRASRFNTVKGTYISYLNYDQPGEYPEISDSNYVAQDNNEKIYDTLDLRFTNRPQTAQRIARIRLERMRKEISLTIRVNMKGLLIQAGDSIKLTHPDYGWNEKAFKVEAFRLLSEGDENAPLLITEFNLREYDASIYSYNHLTDELEVEPAARTNLPKATDISIPTNLSVYSGTNQLDVAGDGTVISRIYASWNKPEVNTVQLYELNYKKSADTNWTEILLPASAENHFIVGVSDGENYDVRVRAVNYFGFKSSWAESYNHTVIGKTEPPPTVDNFNVVTLADGTRRFTFGINAEPSDVRVGGGYEIRYKIGSTTNWESMTPLHSGKLVFSPFESNELAANSYTFAVKAVDSSGNYSNIAKFLGATIGQPPLRGALLQQIEQPDWSGTKTNCFADSDGVLKAISTGNWSGLVGSFSALPDSWDEIAGFATSITFINEVTDLGYDASFTPFVTIDAVGTATIEYKVGKESDGGVTGSWIALGTGRLIGYRYIQFRVIIQNSSNPPSIENMSIILDGDVNKNSYDDINSAAESSAWFERIAAGHFKVKSRDGNIDIITNAKITALQNTGPGWSWELVSKNSDINGKKAAEFKLYNGSGVLADAVVDIEINGVQIT